MNSFKLCKLVNLITFLFSLDYDTFPVARVDDLKLEYLTYPKGIDIRNPQFSWKKLLMKEKFIKVVSNFS